MSKGTSRSFRPRDRPFVIGPGDPFAAAMVNCKGCGAVLGDGDRTPPLYRSNVVSAGGSHTPSQTTGKVSSLGSPAGPVPRSIEDPGGSMLQLGKGARRMKAITSHTLHWSHNNQCWRPRTVEHQGLAQRPHPGCTRRHTGKQLKTIKAQMSAAAMHEAGGRLSPAGGTRRAHRQSTADV